MRRLLPLLVALACASNSLAQAPAELSTIVVPIRASLQPLMPLVEAQVPVVMEKLDEHELDASGRFGVRYKVRREPIALNMIGAGLHVTTNVHYALEGCTQTRNPINNTYKMWPCISCGFHEPMRKAAVALHATVSWDAQWHLRSSTKARPVSFGNRCRVTLFNIDITDRKLGPVVNQQLRDLAKSIDQNTPKLTSIRPIAQQIWSSLQAPTEIAPRTWLVLEPTEVALGPIRGSGLNVTSTLSLRARTRVIVGDKPAVNPRPLPALSGAAAALGGGIRVPLDIEVSYDEASRLLTQQFAGKTYQQLTVRSIKLLPGQKGRAMVEASIDYRGGRMRRYDGVVYLEGTPRFDPATNMISFDDLDYALDPKRRTTFMRIADAFAHNTVRARLRESARWPLTAEIAMVKAEIERGLNRQLSPGVALRGKVQTIQPLSVTPAPNAVSIRILATGTAEIDVKEWR